MSAIVLQPARRRALRVSTASRRAYAAVFSANASQSAVVARTSNDATVTTRTNSIEAVAVPRKRAIPKLFTNPDRHLNDAKIIRSLLDEEKYLDAFKVYKSLRLRGYKPDAYFYSKVFAYFATINNWETREWQRQMTSARHLFSNYLANAREGGELAPSVASDYLIMLSKDTRFKEVYFTFTDLARSVHGDLTFYKTMLSILRRERDWLRPSGIQAADRVTRIWNMMPDPFPVDAELVEGSLSLLMGGTIHHRRVAFAILDQWVHNGKVPLTPSLASCIGKLYKAQWSYARLIDWTQKLQAESPQNVNFHLVKDALYACALSSAWTGDNTSPQALEILQHAVEHQTPLSGNSYAGALMTTWVSRDWQSAKRVLEIITGKPFAECSDVPLSTSPENASTEPVPKISRDPVHPQARHAFVYLAKTAAISEALPNMIELLHFIARLRDPWRLPSYPKDHDNSLATGAIVGLAREVKLIAERVVKADGTEVGADSIELAKKLLEKTSVVLDMTSNLNTREPSTLREVQKVMRWAKERGAAQEKATKTEAEAKELNVAEVKESPSP